MFRGKISTVKISAMKTPVHTFILRFSLTCLGFGASLASVQSARAAEELLGAEKVLQQLAQASAPMSPKTNATPQALLETDLAIFTTNSSSLSPEAAAKAWLALADRVFELNAKPNSSSRSGRGAIPLSSRLLDALPGPAAWPELRTTVESRSEGKEDRQAAELGLRLLVHTLANDTAARKKDLTALENLAKKAPRDSAWAFQNIFRQLNAVLLATSDDSDLVLKTLERELNADAENRWQDSLDIPNLVAIVGEAKTEAFLRKALLNPKVKLEINAGSATHKLAQKLALELIGEMKTPQWGLVNSLGVIKLYEAMDHKFPAKTNQTELKLDGGTLDLPDQNENDHERQSAKLYYLLSLISESRTRDAVATAKNFAQDNSVFLPADGLKALEQAGYTAALDEFFHELLAQNPEVPFWSYYANLAAKAGKTDRMLALARTTLERKDLSAGSKLALQQNLYLALLAADKVEEGVAELRKQIAQPSARRTARNQYFASEEGPAGNLLLAKLGQLEARKDWLEAGIAGAKKSLAESEATSMDSWGTAAAANVLAGLLISTQRSTETEAVLIAEIKKALQRAAQTQGNRYQSYSRGGNSPVAPSLAALTLFYHQAGRPADVITLLDDSPDWGAGDLIKLNNSQLESLDFSGRSYHGRSHGLPLQFIAAAVFAKVGKKTAAEQTLSAVFNRSPGLDAAYALLLELGGDQIPARLDELFARDHFEERPLIWKAEWLRRKGDLEAAEKICRQAISIDPSDGEQGPGDRMRAYAVLAEIRAARGDTKEAEFFHGAVSAIRLAEQADRFAEAGLIKRAVQMYEESLTKFADAYCIQSRLAVQLAELGRHAEAEAHYRKAYELMPESFGRVESHCFGCERAFDGQKAQSLAEKIFSDLAVKTPNKPQVHYLLGYLREEQERYQEAIKHYQEAVKLDPDYLNAWVKLQGLMQHVRLPATQRDDITLNILRLDPASRHSNVSLADVSDLNRVWTAVATAQKLRPVYPKSLYVLKASEAALRKNAPQRPPGMEDEDQALDYYDYANYHRGLEGAAPAKALQQNFFIQMAGQLMSPEIALSLNTN